MVKNFRAIFNLKIGKNGRKSLEIPDNHFKAHLSLKSFPLMGGGGQALSGNFNQLSLTLPKAIKNDLGATLYFFTKKCRFNHHTLI